MNDSLALEGLPLTSRGMPKPTDPTPEIARKVVLVGFPVLLPGEDGRVIRSAGTISRPSIKARLRTGHLNRRSW